jgi:Phosphoribosyl transferase (PRTase)/PELOTA RNA binding domain
MFSGSYDPDDVMFLLKPVHLAPTPLAEKERLIQTGQCHYSEMIGEEKLPSPRYLQIFHEALGRVGERFARHLSLLAGLIVEARPRDITLVSLARAGTPVGVILGRILRRRLGRGVVHYSLSIIRDRGIDEIALRFILERHSAASVVFVDGWTGKGVIAEELRKSIVAFNERHDVALDPGLFAVADLSGTAARAATAEDYLIPSAVLGCTISGLVSRSILNRDVIGPDDFHGCVFYEEYRPHDLSRWFVDELTQAAGQVANLPSDWAGWQPPRDTERRTAFLQNVMCQFKIRNVNYIKPGVGEATRVLLRRVPDLLLLRDPSLPDVAHLRLLAEEKNVPIRVDPSLPYLATALIKEIDG